MTTELAARMRNRANMDKLPPDHEMRTAAEQFDKAHDEQWGPKPFLGAWARARSVWCHYTQEPLV